MRRVTADHPFDVIKPFMVIAAMAFLTGFLGYLSLHGVLF